MKSSIENNPVHNSLIEFLASVGVDRNTYTDVTQLSSVEMSIARNTYFTNLKNMWDKKKLFNSILNHLLDVLLRVHLAPKRERKYREIKEAKKTDAIQKIQQNQEKTFSRNRMRSLVRVEARKLEKYSFLRCLDFSFIRFQFVIFYKCFQKVFIASIGYIKCTRNH
ncbi:hypothetical protein EDC94DRAFT_185419 [Helicostylum pulchrum]|nr:hypothetical protein EDC94DRAFT_185419 [Helicostylum pulchrum]